MVGYLSNFFPLMIGFFEHKFFLWGDHLPHVHEKFDFGFKHVENLMSLFFDQGVKIGKAEDFFEIRVEIEIFGIDTFENYLFDSTIALIGFRKTGDGTRVICINLALRLKGSALFFLEHIMIHFGEFLKQLILIPVCFDEFVIELIDKF